MILVFSINNQKHCILSREPLPGSKLLAQESSEYEYILHGILHALHIKDIDRTNWMHAFENHRKIYFQLAENPYHFVLKIHPDCKNLPQTNKPFLIAESSDNPSEFESQGMIISSHFKKGDALSEMVFMNTVDYFEKNIPIMNAIQNGDVSFEIHNHFSRGIELKDVALDEIHEVCNAFQKTVFYPSGSAWMSLLLLSIPFVLFSLLPGAAAAGVMNESPGGDLTTDSYDDLYKSIDLKPNVLKEFVPNPIEHVNEKPKGSSNVLNFPKTRDADNLRLAIATKNSGFIKDLHNKGFDFSVQMFEELYLENYAAIAFLVNECGISINQKWDEKSLINMIMRTNSLDNEKIYRICKHLISFRIDLNEQDENNNPLILSIRVGRLDLLKLFLANGATTPPDANMLAFAIAYEMEHIYTYLLSVNFDPNSGTDKYVTSSSTSAIIDKPNALSLLKLLINHGLKDETIFSHSAQLFTDSFRFNNADLAYYVFDRLHKVRVVDGMELIGFIKKHVDFNKEKLLPNMRTINHFLHEATAYTQFQATLEEARKKQFDDMDAYNRYQKLKEYSGKSLEKEVFGKNYRMLLKPSKDTSISIRSILDMTEKEEKNSFDSLSDMLAAFENFYTRVEKEIGFSPDKAEFFKKQLASNPSSIRWEVKRGNIYYIGYIVKKGLFDLNSLQNDNLDSSILIEHAKNRNDMLLQFLVNQCYVNINHKFEHHTLLSAIILLKGISEETKCHISLTLIGLGANIREERLYHPLLSAIHSNNVLLIDLFLNYEESYIPGTNILAYAISKGTRETYMHLLNKGFDPNANAEHKINIVQYDDATPLLAISSSKHTKPEIIFDDLIQFGLTSKSIGSYAEPLFLEAFKANNLDLAYRVFNSLKDSVDTKKIPGFIKKISKETYPETNVATISSFISEIKYFIEFPAVLEDAKNNRLSSMKAWNRYEGLKKYVGKIPEKGLFGKDYVAIIDGEESSATASDYWYFLTKILSEYSAYFLVSALLAVMIHRLWNPIVNYIIPRNNTRSKNPISDNAISDMENQVNQLLSPLIHGQTFQFAVPFHFDSSHIHIFPDDNEKKMCLSVTEISILDQLKPQMGNKIIEALRTCFPRNQGNIFNFSNTGNLELLKNTINTLRSQYFKKSIEYKNQELLKKVQDYLSRFAHHKNHLVELIGKWKEIYGNLIDFQKDHTINCEKLSNILYPLRGTMNGNPKSELDNLETSLANIQTAILANASGKFNLIHLESRLDTEITWMNTLNKSLSTAASIILEIQEKQNNLNFSVHDKTLDAKANPPSKLPPKGKAPLVKSDTEEPNHPVAPTDKSDTIVTPTKSILPISNMEWKLKKENEQQYQFFAPSPGAQDPGIGIICTTLNLMNTLANKHIHDCFFKNAAHQLLSKVSDYIFAFCRKYPNIPVKETSLKEMKILRNNLLHYSENFFSLDETAISLMLMQFVNTFNPLFLNPTKISVEVELKGTGCLFEEPSKTTIKKLKPLFTRLQDLCKKTKTVWGLYLSMEEELFEHNKILQSAMISLILQYREIETEFKKHKKNNNATAVYNLMFSQELHEAGNCMAHEFINQTQGISLDELIHKGEITHLTIKKHMQVWKEKALAIQQLIKPWVTENSTASVSFGCK